MTAQTTTPLFAPLPAVPPVQYADIEQAWADRCTTYREFDADPDLLNDHERANDYWDRIDVAENAILSSPAAGIRAAELRLWVAWSHCQPSFSGAVAQGDALAIQRQHDDLDWHEKLIFAAILDLRGGASPC